MENNSGFGRRLKKIRLSRDMSQEEFAALLGTSKQVISRYETNQRTPKITVANEYAIKLGIPLNLLLKDNDENTTDADLPQHDNIVPITKKRIPLIGSIACGEPIFAMEEFECYVDVANSIKADFALRAKGDSMIGARIFDGDIVFIKKQPSVDDGEIAAVIIDDEATLKRVYINKTSITLVAENPKYKPLVYHNDESLQVYILGKAVAFQSTIR